ncbi:MAG: hypothetical protein R8K20_09585 [Gallionellaceae bacterium]
MKTTLNLLAIVFMLMASGCSSIDRSGLNAQAIDTNHLTIPEGVLDFV